jgi:hypothetical protein
MWLFLVFVAVGIFQIWLGYVGIEHHFGTGWAIGAIVAAFGFRLMLPLTAGSYFGAVDVMGWEWYIGLAVAAPGLMFAAPYLITAALEPILSGRQDEQTSYEIIPENITDADSSTTASGQRYKLSDTDFLGLRAVGFFGILCCIYTQFFVNYGQFETDKFGAFMGHALASATAVILWPALLSILPGLLFNSRKVAVYSFIIIATASFSAVTGLASSILKSL